MTKFQSSGSKRIGDLDNALVSYRGTTTADGGIGGIDLFCADLAVLAEFNGNQVVIIDGACAGQARDIDGTTLAGTVTPATPFGAQITLGTKFTINAIRTVPAEVAVIETIVERIDFYDRIFFDHLRGVAGAAYPTGTPQHPCNDIDDVITLLTARNIKVIDVWGILTLTSDVEEKTFIGHRHEDPAVSFNLGGQSVDGSIITGCVMEGTQGGTGFLTLIDCLIYQLVDFQGIANLCDLYGSAMSLRDLGYADLNKCSSVHGDLTITVNAPTRASFKEFSGNLILTAQDGGLCNVRGFKGYLEIDAMTAGTLNIFADVADIQINADCTGGTINIYGNARVIDNSAAGCTVNDNGSSGYKELSATGATVNAYADALDIDARLYNKFTIKLKNTDGANDLDYRVLLRPEHGVAEQMIQPEDITIVAGDYDFVNIDHKWGQVIVQVRATVADSQADYSVYVIANKN